WGPPKNLGPVVNSTYNEDAPFITADDKRLYFSSFGHETMGGFDIFYSDLDANGNWTKPVNLGYPVNSTDDEVFFCPVQNGKVAYVAEYDPAGMGKYDLMRIEIFDSHHPRLYKIAGSIHLPDPTLSKKVSVVVTDRVKRDTVYAAVVPSTEFLFN